MYTCMCKWVTLLYSRKLTEHCKPARTEKIKIIINEKKKNAGGVPTVPQWVKNLTAAAWVTGEVQV